MNLFTKQRRLPGMRTWNTTLLSLALLTAMAFSVSVRAAEPWTLESALDYALSHNPDSADRPAWDRHVLGEVATIPWGRTASYGDIARRIGAPRAARAVGGALGRNPIGLLIPCHRVIAADGTIGGYGGDAWGSSAERLAIKRDLLLREGVTVGTRDQ